MNQYSKHRWPRSNTLVRLILVSTLLLGAITNSLPLVTMAGGPSCALACCAGRTPHAEGSCMNGSCHAFRPLELKSHLDRRFASAQVEPMCGLKQAAKHLVVSASATEFLSRIGKSPVNSD